MPKLFATLTHLPDMNSRRYGLLELGTSNVETIRAEHILLKNACAALLGVEADQLTQEQVEALASRRLAPLQTPGLDQSAQQ